MLANAIEGITNGGEIPIYSTGQFQSKTEKDGIYLIVFI